MAEESDLEKTEQPSQRRLDKAREEGHVARSRELSTFSILLAGGIGLWLMGAGLHKALFNLVQGGLTLDASVAFRTDLMVERFGRLGLETALAFLPLMAMLLAVAAFSPMMINGWLFSTQSLQPNFSRLDPIEGLGRMFSSQGLIELLKSVAKAVIVGGLGIWAVWHHRDEILGLAVTPVAGASHQMVDLIWQTFFMIMGGMLLIVAVDVPYQLWQFNQRLMMTREEVRQDAKETEGDPHVKSKIRNMQREMARRRMMAKIPQADVVVTNPTHYAVALQYREGQMRAPVVVAKGVHLLAGRIRELAEANQVPVVEAPPLARALYAHTELDRAIPEGLYRAVAEILAYVWQLKRARVSGGPTPVAPQDLPVPVDLDPEAMIH